LRRDHPPNLIELQKLQSLLADMEMTPVRWIERSSQNTDALIRKCLAIAQ
jgi:hypothetical protein